MRASSLDALRREGVGDVLEEDEPEDEVLVLGRLDAAAQRVSGLEQRLLGGDVLVVRRHLVWGHLGPRRKSASPRAKLHSC